jgi:GNAT superfamily N-acetyltransferase
MKLFERKKRTYLLSNDPKKLQFDVIYDFISNAYWGQIVTKKNLKISIKNSYCFGLYSGDKQIGFARVITDFGRFGYLADVFVLEKYRGKGLSLFLLNSMLEDPALEHVKRWLLGTRDAHGLYKKLGYIPIQDPKNFMQMKRD